MNNNTIGTRGWRSYGAFWFSDAAGGLFCLIANHWPDYTEYDLATRLFTRDATYMYSNRIYSLEWLSYGNFSRAITYGGLITLYGGDGKDSTFYMFATI